MTFDKIIDNGKLWAVRYEEETDNELFKLFAQWSDVEYLHQFFKANWMTL